VGAALNFVYRRNMCDFRQIKFNHCRLKLKVKIQKLNEKGKKSLLIPNG